MGVKTLLMSVSSSNEDVDYPAFAYVELSDQELERIERLHWGAKALDVYRVCLFDGSPAFFSLSEDLEEELSVDGSGRLLTEEQAKRVGEDVVRETPDNAHRVECITLNVNDDGWFYWTCYLKHTAVRLETASLELRFLKEAQP